MAFSTFTSGKITRNFLTPVNSTKASGVPRHSAKSGIYGASHSNLPAHNIATVAQVMSDDYVTVESTMTAGTALDKVRVMAHVLENIYEIYVVGPGLRLDGIISLRELLISDLNAPVSQIMSHPKVCITTDTMQDRAARIMHTQDLTQLPVIDDAATLVGIVPIHAVSTS